MPSLRKKKRKKERKRAQKSRQVVSTNYGLEMLLVRDMSRTRHSDTVKRGIGNFRSSFFLPNGSGQIASGQVDQVSREDDWIPGLFDDC